MFNQLIFEIIEIIFVMISCFKNIVR